MAEQAQEALRRINEADITPDDVFLFSNAVSDLAQQLEQAEQRIEELERALEAANAAANDYEAWLGAALNALGVKTIFDIPDYRKHLQAAIKEQNEEHATQTVVREDSDE